jgi:hypothetical protein
MVIPGTCLVPVYLSFSELLLRFQQTVVEAAVPPPQHGRLTLGRRAVRFFWRALRYAARIGDRPALATG